MAASDELVLFDEVLEHRGDDPVLVFEPVLGDGRGRETPQAGEGESVVITRSLLMNTKQMYGN